MKQQSDSASEQEKNDLCEVDCVHTTAVRQARNRALAAETAANLAQLFRALGDPSRLRIAALLTAGELCVCDIAAALDLSQSAVSHQLRTLRLLNLVKYRKAGRVAFYSLADDHVLQLYTLGLDHLRHTSGGASGAEVK